MAKKYDKSMVHRVRGHQHLTEPETYGLRRTRATRKKKAAKKKSAAKKKG